MDVHLFQDLERLRKTGNFSQAAAMGNLSQPALSRRIKSLEAWVGTTLVDRSSQPVKLTAAGEQMLEAGLQAVARLEQERSQILEMQSLPDKYVVSFSAQHSIGWRFYPAWLQGLEDAYGPMLTRLRTDNLPNCLRDLKNGDVDFAIAYTRPGLEVSERFDSILIGHDQMIPVCKPDADGQPLFQFGTPGLKLPYLRFGEAAPIGDHLAPLIKEHGLSDSLYTIYENSMGGALRYRARAGDGVAWLPKSLVQPDLDSGVLVHTGKPEWVVDLFIQLLRDEKRSNRTTRSIWSFLKNQTSLPLAAVSEADR